MVQILFTGIGLVGCNWYLWKIVSIYWTNLGWTWFLDGHIFMYYQGCIYLDIMDKIYQEVYILHGWIWWNNKFLLNVVILMNLITAYKRLLIYIFIELYSYNQHIYFYHLNLFLRYYVILGL